MSTVVFDFHCHTIGRGRIRLQRGLTQNGMEPEHLAPDIQEEILFLPRTLKGRDPIRAREVLKLGTIEDWEEQRERWENLRLQRP